MGLVALSEERIFAFRVEGFRDALYVVRIRPVLSEECVIALRLEGGDLIDWRQLDRNDHWIVPPKLV
jgi:hypothetical protein